MPIRINTEFTLPHDIFVMMFSHLRALNKDPEIACEKAGVSYERFFGTQPFILYDESDKLWSECIALSGDTHFGINFGSGMLNYSSGHILITMLHNCKSVELALDCFARYHSIVDNGKNIVSLKKNEEFLALPWIFPKQRNGIFIHQVTSFFSMLASFVKNLSQNNTPPAAVYFSFEQPYDLSVYEHAFRAPLFFNSQKNEIVFRRCELQSPILLADSDFFLSLERQLHTRAINRLTKQTWENKVAESLVDSIYQGNVTIGCTAEKLAVTPRTLQLKLKAEDTSFSRIWEGVRLNFAEFYLGETAEPLSQIALLLSFSDQSSFSKAFKSWTGLTPRHFRIQAQEK